MKNKINFLILSMLLNGVIYADDQSQYFRDKIITQQLPEAEIALKNKDYPKAAELYRSLADKGDKVSQYQLGYLFQNGLGVDKNLQAAAAWYSRANQQGLPEAAFALA